MHPRLVIKKKQKTINIRNEFIMAVILDMNHVFDKEGAQNRLNNSDDW